MRFDDLSKLNHFFLCKLLLPEIAEFAALLDPGMKPKWGPEWLAKYQALVPRYRGAFDKLVKEIAEAAAAQLGMDEFIDAVSLWRETMATIVRQETNLKTRAHLLKMIGFGLGSPRTKKELADLLTAIAGNVEASKKALSDLGVTPEEMAFIRASRDSVEAKGDTLSKERADVDTARAELTTAQDELVAMLRAIALAASTARGRATIAKNADGVAKANDLLNRIDRDLTECRIQSRKRETEEPLPPELTTVDTPAGGNNDGN